LNTATRHPLFCVVCGTRAAGITGYVFFASGHTKIGVPFCKEHLDKSSDYSNPVFENKAALMLFQQRHPRLYFQRVKGKKILFLQATESAKNAT
jgi:hypothetical protein